MGLVEGAVDSERAAAGSEEAVNSGKAEKGLGERPVGREVATAGVACQPEYWGKAGSAQAGAAAAGWVEGAVDSGRAATGERAAKGLGVRSVGSEAVAAGEACQPEYWGKVG